MVLVKLIVKPDVFFRAPLPSVVNICNTFTTDGEPADLQQYTRLVVLLMDNPGFLSYLHIGEIPCARAHAGIKASRRTIFQENADFRPQGMGARFFEHWRAGFSTGRTRVFGCSGQRQD